MLSISGYLGYREYFKNLAENHVAIEGFKYGSEDVVKNDSRSKLAKVFMHCLPYEKARYSGPNVDQQYRRKQVRYAIMRVRSGATFAHENDDFIFCEDIALQIQARIIYYDKQLLNVIIDQNTTEMMPVSDTIGSTQYYGIEVHFDVMDNPGMMLDRNKWNDLTE